MTIEEELREALQQLYDISFRKDAAFCLNFGNVIVAAASMKRKTLLSWQGKHWRSAACTVQSGGRMSKKTNYSEAYMCDWCGKKQNILQSAKEEIPGWVVWSLATGSLGLFSSGQHHACFECWKRVKALMPELKSEADYL